jgi:hypothetical protein
VKGVVFAGSHTMVRGTRAWGTSTQGECTCFMAFDGVRIEKAHHRDFKLEDATRAYDKCDKQTMGKGMIIPNSVRSTPCPASR